MNIVWLMNRLRSMSPAEIAWRVQEQFLRKRARGRLDRWDSYAEGGSNVPQLPGIRDAICRASADVRLAVEAASAKVLGGHFSALGVTWPKIDGRFQAGTWTLDPVTGRHWPGAEAFAFDISYRHVSGLGDIKYVWEYHRLQFLQPVAAHYALTGDGAALAFIKEVIDSWYEHNPPYRGIGWNSGIELGLRAISLLIVGSCCGDRLCPATRQRLRLILISHLHWMKRFPSGFSSANNHLIAECAGEFLIALAMPELPDAAETLAKARTVLEREADKQLLEDGVPAEQSPTYGAFTAEFLLLCAFAARAADVPLHRCVDDALHRYSDFIAWISLANGTVPRIGDDDEGRVVSLGEHENCHAVSVAEAIRGYLGFKEQAARAVPATLRDALFDSREAGQAAQKGTKVFKHGGYSVFRGAIGDRDAMLVFDHGPLGYLSIAAHGHADALAWQLYIQDRPILIDPGTYLYHSGGEWRDWFRGTAAHNTLCLADRNQSTITGAFNWSHKANAELLDYKGGATPWFRARHDGYLKEFGLLHERKISVLPSSIQVTDHLLGDKAAPKVDMIYQLAPGLDATADIDVVSVHDGVRPILKIRFPEDGRLSIMKGEEACSGGWVSNAFGTREPASRIVWTSSSFPSEAVTEFEIL